MRMDATILLVDDNADLCDVLVRLHDSGANLSAISQTVLASLQPFTNFVSVIANVAFVALWFGAVYFLFFWKKRET